MGDLPLDWWVLFCSLPPVPASPIRQAEGQTHGRCGHVLGGGVQMGVDVHGGADVAVAQPLLDQLQIGESAFRECSRLKTVYYRGTEAQWAQISMEDNNDELKNAAIFYNYTGE